jgi:prophage regulatory protein
MRVLSFPDLKSKKGIGFSRVHLYRLVDAGKFPRPIKLSEGRTVAWVEDEVDRWLMGMIAERDNAPTAA